ncbi:MAG: hypothetical protein M1817_001197 [Caeruleum heppii]|nr:MAG: hypothetical protein M1817_001197 [Caeruleum heppii]
MTLFQLIFVFIAAFLSSAVTAASISSTNISTSFFTDGHFLPNTTNSSTPTPFLFDAEDGNLSAVTVVPLVGFRGANFSDATLEARSANYRMIYTRGAINITEDRWLYGLPIEPSKPCELLDHAVEAAATHQGLDTANHLQVSHDRWDFILRSVIADAGLTWSVDYLKIATILRDACRAQPERNRTFAGRLEDPTGRVIAAFAMEPSDMITPRSPVKMFRGGTTPVRIPTVTSDPTSAAVQNINRIPPTAAEWHERRHRLRSRTYRSGDWAMLPGVTNYRISILRAGNRLSATAVMHLLQMVATATFMEPWQSFGPVMGFDTRLPSVVPHFNPLRFYIHMNSEWLMPADAMAKLVFSLSLWLYDDTNVNFRGVNGNVAAYNGHVFWQGNQIGVWHVGF